MAQLVFPMLEFITSRPRGWGRTAMLVAVGVPAYLGVFIAPSVCCAPIVVAMKHAPSTAGLAAGVGMTWALLGAFAVVVVRSAARRRAATGGFSVDAAVAAAGATFWAAVTPLFAVFPGS